MRVRTDGLRAAIVSAVAIAAMSGVAAPVASAADDNYACSFTGTVNFNPAIPVGNTPSDGDYDFAGTGSCAQADLDFFAATEFPLINNSGTFDIVINSEGWYDDSVCATGGGSGHGHGHGTRPVSNTSAVTTIAKVAGTGTPLPAGDEAVFTNIEYHAPYTLQGQGQLDFYAGQDLDSSSPLTTNAGTFSLGLTQTGGNCITTPLATATVNGNFDIDAG